MEYNYCKKCERPEKGWKMEIRHNEHWVYEDYRQRITTKEWKQLLLKQQDKLIFRGKLTQLKAKKLGVGIIEIYKEKAV